MVKIRLKRFGRTHRPYYRVAAMDSRAARDSEAIEEIGWYDPMAEKDEDKIKVDAERVKHWLSVGAQPTETVASLIQKAGVELSEKQKKKIEQLSKARKAKTNA